MFENNQTWYMKKILLQYIVCADNLCNMSCHLVKQQSRHMFLLVISITGIFLIRQSWTLPLYGFWLWFGLKHEYHRTDKKQECHHQQDDYACMLLLAPVIVAITFWWLQYHCPTGDQDFPQMSCPQVDVTLSQSKSQCLLTSFRQTTPVNNCTISSVSYSTACL